MSVFEPLGGILSANLPITYVLFANSFRKLRSVFTKTFSSSGSRSSEPLAQETNRFHESQDHYRGTQHWIRLPKASWSTASSTSDDAMAMTTESESEKKADRHSVIHTTDFDSGLTEVTSS